MGGKSRILADFHARMGPQPGAKAREWTRVNSLGASIRIFLADGSPDGLHHSDFGPNSASHLESLGDGNPWGETSFTYTRKNGIIVNGQLSFDSSDLNPTHPGDGDIFDHTAKCLVSGFVTSTTASP